MEKKPYWKLHEYVIDFKYNERYPVYAKVTINDEKDFHYWRLPLESLTSYNYDMTTAKKVEIMEV